MSPGVVIGVGALLIAGFMYFRRGGGAGANDPVGGEADARARAMTDDELAGKDQVVLIKGDGSGRLLAPPRADGTRAVLQLVTDDRGARDYRRIVAEERDRRWGVVSAYGQWAEYSTTRHGLALNAFRRAFGPDVYAAGPSAEYSPQQNAQAMAGLVRAVEQARAEGRIGATGRPHR